MLKFVFHLRRSSQNLAIWASQRMLFDPSETFCFFYIYFIATVLCCFGIRTKDIQLTALKSFQASTALVVAAEKIPLNVGVDKTRNMEHPGTSRNMKKLKKKFYEKNN